MNQQNVMGCLDCIADAYRYNPVEKYLRSGEWDGVDRHEELCNILGVTDIRHQTYITKWLCQCVALGLNQEKNPIGADGVLVLQGPQGIGKTSVVRKITPYPRWFTEGASIDMSVKDTVITALSGWITELGELDTTLKKEQASLKAFVTRPEDRIRRPYARKDARTPRQTSFCGTVNPKDYLKDETGSRRVWTVPVRKIDKVALHSLTREWVDQLWYQTLALWQLDRNYFRLRDDELEELQNANREFEVALPYEMEIKALLDYDLPVSQWEWWKASEVAALMPGVAGARKVGKALSRISSALVSVFSALEGSDQMGKTFRKKDGFTEYLLPLRHFRSN